MIATSKNLKKTIRELWNIRDVWMTDRDFYLLSSEQLKEIAKINSVAHKKFIPKIRECEEFSINLLSKIRDYQAVCYECSSMGKAHSNWCVGLCIGTKYMGKKKNHTVIIAICTDGVFFVDPQTDQMWKAKKGKDDIFFCIF